MTSAADSDQAWCVVERDGERRFIRLESPGDGTTIAHTMVPDWLHSAEEPVAAVTGLADAMYWRIYRILGPGVAFDRDGEELCAQCDGSGYDNDVRLAGHDGACSVCCGHGRSSDEVPR